MLDTLPQEIFQQVLPWLEKKELKALRLINVAFSQHISKALFRSIDVSCLTLHRLVAFGHHPQLRDMVEELCYHEMLLRPDNPRWVNSRRGKDIENLWKTIRQFCRQPRDRPPTLRELAVEKRYRVPRPEPLEHYVDWNIPMYPGEDLASIPVQLRVQAEFDRMISSVHNVYQNYERRQRLDSLERVFCKYLPLLPNLRRLVSVEAAASENAHSYSIPECFPLLEPIGEHFPLTDAAIRTYFSSYTNPWPGHGFFAMLGALNLSRRLKIQSLETYRGSDLWNKRGVDINEFQMLSPLINGDSYLRVFQSLETLNLCLETSEHESLWNDVLPPALVKAQKLKHLEISLTSLSENIQVPFTSILPMSPLLSLETVILEGFSFECSEMCGWLFLHPMLRTVKLRSARLKGLWKNLLNTLSKNRKFKLQCFELKSPWDHDTQEQEQGRRADTLVPARVSHVDALYFINEGGSNPFETRWWRKFDVWPNEDENTRFRKLNIVRHNEDPVRWPNFEIWPKMGEDMEDNQSEYSDMSEYLSDDHPDPPSDEDLDGPEYDEDYDFDAEDDSDVDMEGT
ncbi:hypothetical protein LTR84_003842 [Exophiala bonariae]|uniref:F-box domain-containing protein n=1 Tax=Exophiala bonariae TaxID=1690606 RepID=A0AAV9N6D2_9EURO|nr:hypothetical protein LTR84_003842 [Exophiala bonariae]